MRIFVKGYFSVNLGDDLFIRTLAERYLEHEFFMIAKKKNAVPYLSIPNVKVIRESILLRYTNKIFNFFYAPMNLYDIIEEKKDITIVIGGSIFQQISGSKRETYRASRWAHGVNPTYIVGANFGPYSTQEYKIAVEKNIEKAVDVCFRDTKSFKGFSQYANVRHAPDMLFGLQYSEGKATGNLYCLISVIDFKSRNSLKQYADSYIHFIHRAIDYYIKQGYSVVLASFCRHEGDEIGIESVISQCNDKMKERIAVLNYDGKNADDMLAVIRNASYIIATRFHSMIMGLSCNIPLIPVVYNEKLMNVLEDLNCKDYGIMPDSLDEFDFRDARYLIIQDIKELRDKSAAHFEELDKVLGRKN